MTRFRRYRMKVCFVWLFLTIFHLQGLHTTTTNRNSSHPKHSRCFKARAIPARQVKRNDATPAPCTAAWTEFDGVMTTVAPHLAFEIRGLENCKTACIRTIPGCVAIDVHPNITICIFHLRPRSELAENRFTALQPGFKQLILNRVCSSGPRIKTGTDERQSMNLATSYGSDSKSCTRQWTVTRDVHSAGYRTHLGVYGEEACKKDCIENIPGCVGIELVKQFDSCNYFTRPIKELIKLRVPMDGNTQHILTKECNSTELSSNETDQQIQQQQQPSAINILTYNATASEDCTANWTEVPDVMSLLYHRHPNTDGREACQKACFEVIPECVAISAPDETTLNRTECIYYVEPLSQVIKSRLPLKGYTQYVLTRECPSNSSARINETDELALQNLTSIGTNITSTEECIWEEHADVYSFGAKLYSKELSTDACKIACLQEIANCVAVDNHGSPYCWYHKNHSNFDSKRHRLPGKGFIQYVRVCSQLKEE